MNFFEYLFCRLYWWNTQIIKENVVPVYYSALGLSGFQMLSMIPLYDIVYIYVYKSFYIQDILGINPYLIIVALFLVINLLYFQKSKYEVLFKIFSKIPQKKKKKKDIWCIVYIVMLIIINVLFTAYIRRQNMAESLYN